MFFQPKIDVLGANKFQANGRLEPSLTLAELLIAEANNENMLSVWRLGEAPEDGDI